MYKQLNIPPTPRLRRDIIGDRLMVGQLVLVQSIGVRIPVPEQIKNNPYFMDCFLYGLRDGEEFERAEARQIFCRISVGKKCSQASLDATPGALSAAQGNEARAEARARRKSLSPSK